VYAAAAPCSKRLLQCTQHPIGIQTGVAIGEEALQALIDQLAAPEPAPALSEAIHGLALEQLVDQLPAAQATAMRPTVLEGLSLRAAAERLEISAMSVMRAQKKTIAALRQQLSGGG
jgi:DNA-directed RNA polymerase specialized sigma24 family protein